MNTTDLLQSTDAATSYSQTHSLSEFEISFVGLDAAQMAENVSS